MSASDSTLAEAKAVLLGMAAEGRELQQALGGPVADAVAGWLAVQYALAAREHLATAQGTQRWEVLRASVQDLAELRRGDHAAVRLQLERERLELDRQRTQEHLEKVCLAWAHDPANKQKLHPTTLTPEEQGARLRAILA